MTKLKIAILVVGLGLGGAYLMCGEAERTATAPPPGIQPAPPAAAPAPPAPNPTRARIAAVARSMLGKRYRWGGSTRLGVDCSGLVVLAYRSVDVRLPHDSGRQFYLGRPVAYADLLPGDLVFYYSKGKPLGHVGIYVGNDLVVHASYSRGRVVLARLSASLRRGGVSALRRLLPP